MSFTFKLKQSVRYTINIYYSNADEFGLSYSC